ncbi:hypothetical protein ILYODFUR_031078 [Ilyodon furcidens]|uniref:Uncharacterized protein n=2 Tax=Goodeidae TaxID=28758 RepID=A0ABV0T1Q0_9TELE
MHQGEEHRETRGLYAQSGAYVGEGGTDCSPQVPTQTITYGNRREAMKDLQSSLITDILCLFLFLPLWFKSCPSKLCKKPDMKHPTLNIIIFHRLSPYLPT